MIIKIETSVTDVMNILEKPYTISELENSIIRANKTIEQRKNAINTLCLCDFFCKYPNYVDRVVINGLEYLQSISGEYPVLQRILPKLRKYLKHEYEKEVLWHTKGLSPGSII